MTTRIRFQGGLLWATILILLLGRPTAAADQTVTVDDVAGSSLQLAIANGLVQAIEQIKGVEIKSRVGYQLKHQEAVREVTDGFKSYSENLSIEDLAEGSIVKATNGLVRSYRVLSQREDGATRHWRVSLEVTVPVYDPENPRPGSKRTMAVVPFRAAQGSFQLSGERVPSSEINRLFVDSAEIHFTQSRRFLILNRTFEKELQDELRRIKTDDFSLEEQLKLGQRLGVDYLVVGTLEDFASAEHERVVKLTGYRGLEMTARYYLSFKVLNVATSRVHWADHVRGDLDNEDFKRISESDRDLRMREFLAERAAGELAAKVMDSIYPIKVAKVGRKEIILNRGGVRMKEGAIFEVFAPGEQILDPDTNEVLGTEDELVALVAISRVDRTFSWARILEGRKEDIEIGWICRPKSVSE